MNEQSIAAYDVSQRVKTYDADMELMHPNRSKMVRIALEVPPLDAPHSRNGGSGAAN
jgi:hypothetical protein